MIGVARRQSRLKLRLERRGLRLELAVGRVEARLESAELGAELSPLGCELSGDRQGEGAGERETSENEPRMSCSSLTGRLRLGLGA